MKTWIIASIVLGILVIGGFAVVSAISNSADNAVGPDDAVIQAKTIGCSGCGNGCNAESNCGLATCGAVSGSGSCGCGK